MPFTRPRHSGGTATPSPLPRRNPADGIGGGGAFFLLLDEPEVYGLPPDPVVTTRDLPGIWKHAAIAAAGLAATAVGLGLGRRR